jgi:hypothetical protein
MKRGIAPINALGLIPFANKLIQSCVYLILIALNVSAEGLRLSLSAESALVMPKAPVVRLAAQAEPAQIN